jgi:hypothetical protein
LLDRFLDEAELDYWKGVIEKANNALNLLRRGSVPENESRDAAIVLLLVAAGPGNARRLCPLDTNLLRQPNSPDTQELPR